MDYKASLIGERKNGESIIWAKVVVPVTSLCPCSRRFRTTAPTTSART
jgi:GTP cyclohydrolase IB